jgi:hypothetical protein
VNADEYHRIKQCHESIISVSIDRVVLPSMRVRQQVLLLVGIVVKSQNEISIVYKRRKKMILQLVIATQTMT